MHKIITWLWNGLLLNAARAWYYGKYRRSHRKYVVIGNKQVGLGNRLIALANTYTWCGNDNISLVWKLDHWVTEPFERLFKLNEVPGFHVISPKRRFWSRAVFIPAPPEGNTLFWQFWAPPGLRKDLPNGKLFCAYNETPLWARELYGKFFASLQPSDEVRQRIDSCPIPDDVVCVQFRHSHGKGDTAGVAKLEKMYALMDAYGPEQRFFISCMEEDVSRDVHARYEGRVLELPNKRYRSMVDAVADMWLLGGGRELICQNGSTFPEVAWWWRGCKAKVTKVIRDYYQLG